MSEIEPKETGQSDEFAPLIKKDDMPTIVYALYAASFIVGITAIIGVVLAYMKRGDADATAASHYTFQIRTFWIGLLGGVVGAVTSVIFVGILILIAVVIWMIIRIVKGFLLYNDGKPVPDPETWTW